MDSKLTIKIIQSGAKIEVTHCTHGPEEIFGQAHQRKLGNLERASGIKLTFSFKDAVLPKSDLEKIKKLKLNSAIVKGVVNTFSELFAQKHIVCDVKILDVSLSKSTGMSSESKYIQYETRLLGEISSPAILRGNLVYVSFTGSSLKNDATEAWIRL